MTFPAVSVPLSRRRLARGDAMLLWLIPAACYYAFLLTVGGGLFAPVRLGLTFNSMLLHLLQGRFDVDPATIGAEGYRHGGLIYAYFGVFPALFRAAFLWVPDFARVDFTRLSCLVAVLLMAGSKMMTVRLMWREAGERAAPALLAAMVAAILLGGAQVQFLRPSIYQEVVLWAGAFAAGFLYLLLRGLCREAGFTPRLLTGMAALAALALLTRVSTAIGLYAAFGAVWLWVAWRDLRRRGDLWPLVLPAAIAGLGIGLAALVNFERFGNPLVFLPLSEAVMLDQYPERLHRVQTYGEFNIARVGYSFLYYFFPIWVLRDGSGQLWWGDFLHRYYDGVELPASSFFVSDPLLLSLAAFGVLAVWRNRDKVQRRLALVCGFGLAIPGALMLAALGATFRYRMEFYPLFELFAFLGFGALAARPAGQRPAFAPAFAMAGAVVSVVAAHALWLLYMLSPFGPADQNLGALGLVDFYRSLVP